MRDPHTVDIKTPTPPFFPSSFKRAASCDPASNSCARINSLCAIHSSLSPFHLLILHNDDLIIRTHLSDDRRRELSLPTLSGERNSFKDPTSFIFLFLFLSLSPIPFFSFTTSILSHLPDVSFPFLFLLLFSPLLLLLSMSFDDTRTKLPSETDLTLVGYRDDANIISSLIELDVSEEGKTKVGKEQSFVTLDLTLVEWLSLSFR